MKKRFTVAIVGSRDYQNISNVTAMVSTIDQSWMIVTGDRGRVDKEVVRACRVFENDFICFEPRFKTMGLKAGPMRNTRMLESGVDFVYAYLHDMTQPSKGTWDVVNKAVMKGIPIYIIDERGRVSLYDEVVRMF